MLRSSGCALDIGRGWIDGGARLNAVLANLTSAFMPAVCRNRQAPDLPLLDNRSDETLFVEARKPG
jgi:hypothetical protein